MFELYRTQWYSESFHKLAKFEQERVIKIEDQIRFSPFTGKPLSYSFFREKRFDGKRLLFLVYNDISCVLLIAISGKKNQQEDIDKIKSRLSFFKDEIKRLNLLNSSV